MKASWKRHVKIWQIENIGETLTKKNFPKVFKATWDSVTRLEIAARGFRRSGLFPLDPSAIDKTKLDPSKIANLVAVSQRAKISAPAQIELTNPLPSTSQQTTPTSPITIAVETPQTPKSNYMGISTPASQNLTPFKSPLGLHLLQLCLVLWCPLHMYLQPSSH